MASTAWTIRIPMFYREGKEMPMRAMDFDNIDRNALVDLQTVQVNTELPKHERMLDFIRQIKTPNCFKVGKYVVCLSFSDTGPTLQSIFEDLTRSKAGG